MVRSETADQRRDGNWWLLSLGDAIEATPVLQTVRECFERHWQHAGQPEEMSLWLRTDSDGLHCRQTLFFSPGCQALAEQFRAVVCPPPLRAQVQWLAGARAAVEWPRADN